MLAHDVKNLSDNQPKALADAVVAKFAHDIASPLGGIIMALEMLEDSISSDDLGQQSLKVAQEAVGRIKALIEVWRHVFLLADPSKENTQFLSYFQEFVKANLATLQIAVPMSGTLNWQVRMAGLLLLCLGDRLAHMKNGVLTFSSQSVNLSAEFEKGDLFDRIRSLDSIAQQPATRVVLPHHFHNYASEHNIHLSFSATTPFECLIKKL